MCVCKFLDYYYYYYYTLSYNHSSLSSLNKFVPIFVTKCANSHFKRPAHCTFFHSIIANCWSNLLQNTINVRTSSIYLNIHVQLRFFTGNYELWHRLSYHSHFNKIIKKVQQVSPFYILRWFDTVLKNLSCSILNFSHC